MANIMTMVNKMIPISQFNKGQASKIFERLNKEKFLVVLKNNQASAIILSPAEYSRLSEIEEDYRLLIEANKRINDNNSTYVSYEDALKTLSVDPFELKVAEEVDI